MTPETYRKHIDHLLQRITDVALLRSIYLFVQRLAQQ